MTKAFKIITALLLSLLMLTSAAYAAKDEIAKTPVNSADVMRKNILFMS